MPLLLLALIAQQPAYPGEANWAYVQCLTAQAGAAASLPEPQFESRLLLACPDEARTIRDHIIETESARGLGATEAEAAADRYFRSIRDQMRDLRPVDED